MDGLELALICAVIVGTSFLSGLFGMAGGMILIGVLLAMLPVPAAMALHAVTQISSNGWRAALWIRHVDYRIAGVYMAGALVILGVWSIWRWIPPLPLTVLLLGLIPFSLHLIPKSFRPDPTRRGDAAIVGAICMMLMLTTGVTGPFLDSFMLGGGKLERRTIVATKSLCQTFGHAAKFLYFGAIVDVTGSVDPLTAAAAIAAATVGTILARRPLERMGDAFYRRWSWRIVYTIAAFYTLNGLRMMVLAV
ncbi:MAG: sulfite exporter TauE/SafE family protein [Proteobacteria bacterium]|nr:sulfite exporter TauE/SafE family protein [Pseudomonadota bacterium]